VRVVLDRPPSELGGPAGVYDRLDIPAFGFDDSVVTLQTVTSG
jgi:hypothetical protein